MFIPRMREKRVAYLLDRSGIWINSSNGIFISTIYKCFPIYCAAALTAQIVCIYYEGYMRSLKGTAFFGAISLMTNLQQLYLLFNQKTVEELVLSLDSFEKIISEEWEYKILRDEMNFAWKVASFYNIACTSYFIVYLTLPFLLDSIIGQFYKSLPNLRVVLGLQGFIDMTEPRGIYNVLLSSVSIFWSYLCLNANIAIICSLLAYIVNMRAELKIICRHLIILKENVSKMDSVNTDLAVKKFISHHQLVLGFIRRINAVYGFYLALQNTIKSIVFCLNMVAITIMSDDMSVVLQNAFSGFTVLAFLSVLCTMGESLETENNEFLICVSDLPWYEKNAKFRRDITMAIRQANKELYVNYQGRYFLNIATFMQTLNTAYSCFMVLKTMAVK